MSEGYLSAESDRSLSGATITWTDKDSDDITNLAIPGGFLGTKQAQIPGFMCGTCGTLELQLTEDELSLLRET